MLIEAPVVVFWKRVGDRELLVPRISTCDGEVRKRRIGRAPVSMAPKADQRSRIAARPVALETSGQCWL